MYEFRWLIKHHKNYPNISPTQILQYRCKYDSTVYASISAPDSFKNMVWSEWKDVPVVNEVI